MPLIKISCPNCRQTYTINPDSVYQVCPICHSSLYKEDELDIPDLSMPEDLDDLSSYVRYGFKLLYFRSYDRLKNLSEIMMVKYPEYYWSMMFELIGRTNIDFVFLLPKVEYELTKEELDEDARSRYYHYARKKYAQSPQMTFNRIAGYYPDLPGDNRKKWRKAKTKYDERVDVINKYFEISNLIRSEYLSKLDQYAETDDERKINHNLKIWISQIVHARSELFLYNESINNQVKKDYENTPNPGNKPLFASFSTLYIISFLVFVWSLSEIILGFTLPDGLNPVFSYVAASISSILILISVVLLTIKGPILKRLPVVSVILIVAATFICGSGIATAGIRTKLNWFSVFSIVIALISMFYAGYKMIKYFPHGSRDTTIIGNFPKLANNSFDVQVEYEFKKFEGDEPEEIIFSKDWFDF